MTPEAAVAGIDEKDARIEQMRQRYALVTGVDPLTNQPVQSTAVAPQDQNYYSNPDRYLDDLYKAAKEGGPQAYRDVQAKFMLDTLQPIAPLMQRMAKEQALEEVAKKLPDIREFSRTPAWQGALEANPELRDAVSVAETDFRWHNRLPDLYQTAYWTGKGMQLPDLLRANAQQQNPNNSTQPQVRPTQQPTTVAMPTQTTQPSFGTPAGLRSIIADAESRGVSLNF
jgi:hypothetical protein